MTIGLGAMIGAGVFAVLAPASEVAGAGLLLGLGLAAIVAYANAASCARLAALHPASGGAYVYGRERLGTFWGYLAGCGFVAGKTASCAAMALTFGAHVAPKATRPLAVGAVVVLTALNLGGVQKSLRLTRAIVAVVLAVLATVVVGALAGGQATVTHLGPLTGGGVGGVLRAAGLLFFAFAGYARLATLGEEVSEPARTIPRAIPLALGITLLVYVVVATAALLAVGPAALAGSHAPLATAVRAGRLSDLAPVVRVGGAVASLGALLSLILGVSRTVFAMAADGHLPRTLATVHPVHEVPQRAELAVAAGVVAIVAVLDVRDAIGFSAFTVLVYYAIANAAAWTLPAGERRAPMVLPSVGLVGCTTLAATLPRSSVAGGVAVFAVGSGLWAVRRIRRRRRASRRSLDR